MLTVSALVSRNVTTASSPSRGCSTSTISARRRVTATENSLCVPCGPAPPAIAVALSAVNAAALPSATFSVLPPDVYDAVSSSVAACTVPVASPRNVTLGFAVPASDSVTPLLMLLPAFSAKDQSAKATLSPPTASGTTSTSPSASARSTPTVNDALPFSLIAPEPTRASDTVAASSLSITYATEPAVAEIAVSALWTTVAVSTSVSTIVSSASGAVSPDTRI